MILHAPLNVASIMSATVKGLNWAGYNAFGLSYPGADNHVHTASRWEMFYKFPSLLARADLVHWHYDSSCFSRFTDDKWLKFFDTPGIVEWHGSDIRDPELEADTNRYYRKALDEGYEYKEDAQKAWKAQKRFERLGFYTLVNTPALRRHIHTDVFFYLNRRIFLRDFNMSGQVNEVPSILFAPSKPIVKGAKWVYKAVDLLRRSYKFHFEVLTNLSRHEVLRAMQKADIVLDQFVLGDIGMVSIEAMAMGKPVVCFIKDDLKETYKDSPIVQVHPETLAGGIEKLLRSREMREARGIAGRIYAGRYYSIENQINELVRIYEITIGNKLNSRRNNYGMETGAIGYKLGRRP